MAKNLNIKALFTADSSDIEKKSKRATDSVNDFDKKTKKALDSAAGHWSVLKKKMGNFGDFITGVAGKLAAVVVSVKALGSAIRTMAAFESANSTLAAVLGKTRSEIKGLTEAAIQLGSKTSYTASEVTGLQTELAKLGFSDKQIIAMQEGVLKFAAAVGTDLPSAAARAGATMRGFDLTADESADMLALMAVSTSKSALSFDYLDSTLGKVIPVTKSYGLSARDTIALLGTLANAGIDASSAGTALRRIMAELADRGSKLNRTLGYQPKTMEEIIAAMRSLKDRGLSVSEAFDLVGKNAGATFLALVNGADSCEDLYGALGDVNGQLDEMYRTMTDNLEGAANSLKSAWEGFILQLRSSTGPIKTVINELTKLLQFTTNTFFKSARDADMKSKYSSILGGIVDEKGIEAARAFVEQQRGEIEALIDKPLKGKFRWYDALGGEFLAKREILKKQYKSELAGIEAAMAEIEAAQANKTEDEDPGEKKKKKGGDDDFDLAALRAYAKEAAEVAEADNAMAEAAAKMYESYREANPVIDESKQRLIGLANYVAALVKYDQEAGTANNKFAETLYNMSDGFLAAGYAAGIMDDQLTEAVDNISKKYFAFQEKMWEISKQLNEEVLRMLGDAFMTTFEDIGTFIGEALTGQDDAAANFSAKMLGTFGDMCVRLGEMIVSASGALEAIQLALNFSGNPYAAAAAGAALIAVGAAVKAGAASIAKGGGYSASSMSGSYAAASYGENDYIARDISINVTGRLVGSGSSLIGVIESENNRRNHTT